MKLSIHKMKKIELKELCIKKGINYGNYKKIQKFQLINMLQFYYANVLISFFKCSNNIEK